MNRKPERPPSLSDHFAEIQADGSLLVHLPGGPFRVSPWHHGLRWYRYCPLGKAWQEQRKDPDFPLLTEERLRDRHSAVARFARAIPPELVALALRFPAWQTTLLRLLACHAAARDLATHNPLLLWLLARHVDLRRAGQERVRELLGMKQATLLGAVAGLQDASPAHVRFLRKVEPRAGTGYEMDFLLRVLRNGELVRAARHLPALTMELVESVSGQPFLLGAPALHRHLIHHGCDVHARFLCRRLRDTYELACATVGRTDAMNAIMRTRSDRGIIRLHDRYLALHRDLNGGQGDEQWLNTRALDRIRYPDPLLPGTRHIIPLRTARELWEEGKEMEHCVFTYHGRILLGECHIYRVLQPQRCTLEVLHVLGKPELGQVVLARNREPSAATLESVREWFEQARRRCMRS